MKILRSALRPISGKPVLFVVLTLLGAVAPIAAITVGEPRRAILLFTLAESALFGYLFSALSIIVRRRWIEGSVVGLYCVWALVEILHRMMLHYPLSFDSVMLALGTNPGEVSGFVSTFLTPTVIAALVAGLAATAVIIILTFRADTLNLRMPGWMATILMCGVIAGAASLPSRLAFLSIKDYNRFLVWETQGSDNPELINTIQLNHASPIPKALYIAKYVGLQSGLNNRWRQVQEGVMRTRIDSDSDPDLQLVIVIGESFIKSHSSLYGYHLNVNPILEREFNNGNLTAFSDYITSANFTVASIRNLMNTNCIGGNDGVASDWYESAYLPAVFARGGWQVNLFSNQYAPGDAKGDLGGMLFDRLMTDSCYSAYNRYTRRYDLDFINSISDSIPILRHPRGMAFDIWHLKGQHFPPSNDFPNDSSEFRRFSYKDIPADRDWLDKVKRQVVADYANATAYNDSVVGQILNLYRDKKAIVVYFSDHGEEMYDTAPFANRNRQRPEDPDWMHRQFDIPAFVWFSDKAKDEMPELWDAVGESATKPGMLDAMPQMLMHLGGLTKSPFYSPAYDILSPDYRAYPRVTVSGYRYDD